MINIYVIVSYFIGLIDLIASIFCISKASKLRPNTYFGFRIPQAFLTQKIWTKVNILAGMLGFINFVIIVILSLFVQNICLMMYAILSIMFIVSALSIYSRRIIERETGRESGGEQPVEVLPVIKINTLLIFLGWIIIGAFTIFVLLSRYQLPEIIAVHFNIEGNPDIFMHRDEFLISFTALTIGSMITLTSILFSIKDVPSLKEFESYNKALVSILQVLIICIPLLQGYVYLVIYLYNAFMMRVPIIVDVSLTLALVLIIIFGAIKYLRKETSQQSHKRFCR